jgi:hypothetical protein
MSCTSSVIDAKTSRVLVAFGILRKKSSGTPGILERTSDIVHESLSINSIVKCGVCGHKGIHRRQFHSTILIKLISKKKNL